MTEWPAHLVVRRASTRGTLLLTIVAGLAAVAALGVAFELGRYAGGYDILAAASERTHLQAESRALTKQNTVLRKRIVELDTLRVGHEQERAELAHTIGALQAQVASQAEQLVVYRGLVAHGPGGAQVGTGLAIDELHITAGNHTGRYEVHLMLLETARPQSSVMGTYELSVEGREQGKPTTLQFQALTGGKGTVEPFKFRYFQSLRVDIALPPGFSPEHLTVELRTGGKRVNPLIQTFPWKVDAV